jgi:hypothetical protein
MVGEEKLVVGIQGFSPVCLGILSAGRLVHDPLRKLVWITRTFALADGHFPRP